MVLIVLSHTFLNTYQLKSPPYQPCTSLGGCMEQVLHYDWMIDRLNELAEKALKGIVEGDHVSIREYLQEKANFERMLSTQPAIVEASRRDYEKIKEAIRKGTLFEKVLSEIGKPLDDELMLEYEELQEIASDIYDSWFCGADYVKAMIKVERIVVPHTSLIDSQCNDVFAEARRVYAFGQYLSAVMLCRLLLERICHNLKQNKPSLVKTNAYGDISFLGTFRCINARLKGFDVEIIYKEMSEVVHGKKMVDAFTAREFMKKTSLAIENLIAIL